MTTRKVGAATYTLTYDAENRLVSVTGGGVTASFVYDGDSQRVKGTVNGTTTTYIGNHSEWTASTATSYYYAGAAGSPCGSTTRCATSWGTTILLRKIQAPPAS